MSPYEQVCNRLVGQSIYDLPRDLHGVYMIPRGDEIAKVL